MTTRANIKITILQVLDRLPAAYTQRVSALRAEVSLDMSPSPGTADIDLAIRELEALRLITSTTCLITGERKSANLLGHMARGIMPMGCEDMVGAGPELPVAQRQRWFFQ